MESSEILVVLRSFIKILDELSISYYIGGSLASSVYGLPRSTMDVDIIADIQLFHIVLLKEAIENDFYLDEDMIKEAVENSTSFNLIHLETAIKIDVFIQKRGSYYNNVLIRKQKEKLIDNDKSSEYYF